MGQGQTWNIETSEVWTPVAGEIYVVHGADWTDDIFSQWNLVVGVPWL